MSKETRPTELPGVAPAESGSETQAAGESATEQVAQPENRSQWTWLPVPTSLLSHPAGKRLLWISGLGVAATVGLLEWPVAVAVAAGSVVAEQLAREGDAARRAIAT